MMHNHRRRSHTSCCRFTLVEIVASLIILGVLVAVSGMWMANVAKGFERARTNAECAQKAQSAIARLTKELAHNCVVDSFSASAITFTSAHYPDGQTVALSGTHLLLGTDVLLDGVSSFTVNVVTVPTIGADTSVTFSFTLTGTGNIVYTETVYP